MNDVFRYAISLALFLAATWLFKAATRLFSAAHGIAVARMPDCPCSRTSQKNGPDQGAILFLVVPVVTVTFDNCYVVATMFPAAMPATVMIAVVLCTGTSILAIVSAIVAAIAVVSIVTDVNANSLGAHHAWGRQSDNGRTNKGKFFHLYLH